MKNKHASQLCAFLQSHNGDWKPKINLFEYFYYPGSTVSKRTESAKKTASRKRAWSQIEEELICSWYFNVKPVREWSLNAFDEEYYERNRTTKRMWHFHFSRDLTINSDTFPDDNEITVFFWKKTRKKIRPTIYFGQVWLFWKGDKWQSHKFDYNDKQPHLSVCTWLLFRSEYSSFLKEILTCGEKWVLYDDAQCIVISTIKKSGDITMGLKYIHSMYYHQEFENRNILDIISHLLKLIINYPEYLSQDPSYEILENDYLRIIWSPLLELLFINNKNIRIICSESCNSYGSSNKAATYNESKNVIGLKIDVRIVLRYLGTDYDLVNGEVACHSGDSKVVEDEGKLTREGKDMVDLFVDTNCTSIFPFLMQLIGPSIDISTIHLTSPGLYTSLPRYNVTLPGGIADLEDTMLDLLENLLTLRSYVITMSDELSTKLKEIIDTRASLGKGKGKHVSKVSEMQYWTRPTYYTPPKDAQSRVAPYLYGVKPPSNLLEKLLKVSFATPNTNDKEIDCPYGWMEKDGGYYNVISGEYSDEHVCCNY